MIEQIENSLKRTSKTLRNVFEELGLDIEDFDLSSLTVDTCDNCGIWFSKSKLSVDKNGNLICGFCKANIGS